MFKFKSWIIFICVLFLVVQTLLSYYGTVKAEETSTDVNIPAVEMISKEEETTTHKTIRQGFVKETSKIYYYLENGEKAKGFLEINKNTYYFDSKGMMVIGFKRIKRKKYYFNKSGKMSKGLVKIKKHNYYFNSKGVMQYGLKKIRGSKYYFKKTGKMHKGFLWRKIQKRKIRNYFDKNGKLKTGKFRLGKVVYKAKKKSGRIYFINNIAPVICQRPQLPTGCEITAWTMMVKYTGKKMNKFKAARVMPRSGNPNYGFMGSPYSSHGRGLVVYPNGLAGITKQYLKNIRI